MFLGYSKGSVRPNFVVTNGRLKAESSKQQNHGFFWALSFQLWACLEPLTRCFSVRGYVEPQNLFLKDYRRLSENGYLSQSLRQAHPSLAVLEILECIPVVIIFAFLDLEKNISFSDSLLEKIDKRQNRFRHGAAQPTHGNPGKIVLDRKPPFFGQKFEIRSTKYVMFSRRQPQTITKIRRSQWQKHLISNVIV